jgi:hypothetical protein
MAVVYRMHVEEDEPALRKLWSEETGWDRLDAEAWNRRFRHTPLGPARFAVAEDAATGQLLAQLAFFPSLVSVDGQEVAAHRPFAPIIARAARGLFLTANPLEHPAVRLHRAAVDGLRAEGSRLLYTLPDPQWLLLARMLPAPALQIGSFPLWTLPLPLPAPLPLGAGYRADPADPCGDAVDRLWRRASALHGCLVVRDSRGLAWKVREAGCSVLGVERGGDLVGLVASRAKGERQWLVCDLLAADAGEALEATLAAVCNLAHSRSLVAGPDDSLRKVGVLATGVLEPVLRRLGFARDQYDFPLMVNVIDPSLDKQRVAPARWYVSPND